MWSVEQGRGCWNPTFIKLFDDWEMEHIGILLFRLKEKRVNEGVKNPIQ